VGHGAAQAAKVIRRGVFAAAEFRALLTAQLLAVPGGTTHPADGTAHCGLPRAPAPDRDEPRPVHSQYPGRGRRAVLRPRCCHRRNGRVGHRCRPRAGRHPPSQRLTTTSSLRLACQTPPLSPARRPTPAGHAVPDGNRPSSLTCSGPGWPMTRQGGHPRNPESVNIGDDKEHGTPVTIRDNLVTFSYGQPSYARPRRPRPELARRPR
jgi:hypothetical protein